MLRSASFAIIFAALTAGLWAQSDTSLQHSELSAQVTGVFTRGSHSGPTNRLAKNSAGLLLGYRIHLTHWEAIEFEYGYTRNGQTYITPGTAPGAPAVNNLISTTMQEAVANEVITTPRLFGFFQPFFLGGGGVLIFSPHLNTSGILATTQTKGAFNYGAGVDFHLGHIGARAEYQGLIFKIPDFNNPALAINHWTHIAQPSVGLILTF